MTPRQFRQLLALARKEPCFEAYIQQKRRQIKRDLERKAREKLQRT